MAYVNEIVLHGLLGRSDILRFNFNRDINVLFGENGCGKTTILKVMAAALSNDSTVMERLPIQRAEVTLFTFAGRHEVTCVVPCDHIPRRSWPLFRAKAILNELIADLARSSSSPQLAAGVIVE